MSTSFSSNSNSRNRIRISRRVKEAFNTSTNYHEALLYHIAPIDISVPNMIFIPAATA